MNRFLMATATATAAAVLAVACGATSADPGGRPLPGDRPVVDPVNAPGGDPTGAPTGGPGATPTTPPAGGPTGAPGDRPTVVPIVVDWAKRPADLDLGDGWRAAGCEGEAPLLCVTRNRTYVGLLELMMFPPSEDEYPEANGTPESLEALGRRALAGHRADREAGCPKGHTFVADPVRRVAVAGGDGVHVAFSIRNAQGRLVERASTYLTVRDHRLVIIGAEALTEDGCVHDDEFQGFAPNTLVEFDPTFERIVAGSQLPA